MFPLMKHSMINFLTLFVITVVLLIRIIGFLDLFQYIIYLVKLFINFSVSSIQRFCSKDSSGQRRKYQVLFSRYRFSQSGIFQEKVLCSFSRQSSTEVISYTVR